MLDDNIVRAVVSQLFDKWDMNRSYTLEGSELNGFFNEAFHMLRLITPVSQEEIQAALKSWNGVATKEELVNAIYFINTHRKAQFIEHQHHASHTSGHYGPGLLIGTQSLPPIVPQQQMHTTSYVGNTVVYPGQPHSMMPMNNSYATQPPMGQPPMGQPPMGQPPIGQSAAYHPQFQQGNSGFVAPSHPYSPPPQNNFMPQQNAPQFQHYDRVGNQPPNQALNAFQPPPQQKLTSTLGAAELNRYARPNSPSLELAAEKKLRQTVDRMFDKYDIDRSGSLDVSELANTLNAMLAELQLPIAFTYEDSLELMHSIDTNHDKRVQKDELLSCLRNLYREREK